jgi:hypothetical protein
VPGEGSYDAGEGNTDDETDKRTLHSGLPLGSITDVISVLGRLGTCILSIV